jgi:hypothetical protein
MKILIIPPKVADQLRSLNDGWLHVEPVLAEDGVTQFLNADILRDCDGGPRDKLRAILGTMEVFDSEVLQQASANVRVLAKVSDEEAKALRGGLVDKDGRLIERPGDIKPVALEAEEVKR